MLYKIIADITLFNYKTLESAKMQEGGTSFTVPKNSYIQVLDEVWINESKHAYDGRQILYTVCTHYLYTDLKTNKLWFGWFKTYESTHGKRNFFLPIKEEEQEDAAL